MMMQNRFRSSVLWTSLFALVFFVTKEWIGFEIPRFEEFVQLVMGCLIAFGIVNNPTDKNNF